MKKVVICLLVAIVIGLFVSINKDILYQTTTSVKKVNTWNVYIEKVSVNKDKSSVKTGKIIISDTKLGFSYEALLNKPGDVVVFNILIKNDGTTDGIISLDDIINLSEEQDKYLEYSIEYKGDIIKHHSSKKYIVSLKYKGDIEYNNYEKDYKDLYYGFNFIRK